MNKTIPAVLTSNILVELQVYSSGHVREDAGFGDMFQMPDFPPVHEKPSQEPRAFSGPLGLPAHSNECWRPSFEPNTGVVVILMNYVVLCFAEAIRISAGSFSFYFGESWMWQRGVDSRRHL